jgi:circadian clock protein KaiC
MIEQVDAAELSPGEFSHRVRRCVDEGQIKTVVIDSINGYQAAMPEENALVLHMHELLLYLNRKGAATFMTVAQHGLVGDMQAPVDITYLADTVILLRYFEAWARFAGPFRSSRNVPAAMNRPSANTASVPRA